MATIELSITPDYVNWGVWESVREIFQNAVDAHDIGNPMSYKYYPNQQMLVIANEGASIERRNLALGGSSKRSDSRQRGKYGEGMKLAWASLLERGYTVTIASQGETWKPCIEWSDFRN